MLHTLQTNAVLNLTSTKSPSDLFAALLERVTTVSYKYELISPFVVKVQMGKDKKLESIVAKFEVYSLVGPYASAIGVKQISGDAIALNDVGYMLYMLYI